MVETVDVITPIVDDPYTFGGISAANSVSDVYAMGGTPLTALAILGYASCDFGPDVIKQLLEGAVNKLREAGACLIGGHSVEDDQFKCGFAVSGTVEKDALLKVAGARAGEILVITKPIGTGILTSAVKLKKMPPSKLIPVIESMLTLNNKASKAAIASGSSSATDVTGFGLLGHALNIARSSKVDLVIDYDKVPLMDKVGAYIRKGVVPKGARNNLAYCDPHLVYTEKMQEADLLSLADPQTSGGLLISIPQAGFAKFKRTAKSSGLPYWIIGETVRGKGRIVIR